MKDLYTKIDAVPALNNIRIADDTAAVGSIVDLQSALSCTFIISAGTIADADATFTPEIRASNDGSGFTNSVAVDDVHLIGTEALATFSDSDDNTVKKIGVLPHEYRYVRLTLTPASNAGNADFSAVAVLEKKYQK